jgi:hypothetical protein
MITFKQHYRQALFEAEGDRVGIPHIWSANKPELYSMNYETFVKFINFLKQNNDEISPSSSNLSEKLDGMSLTVGKDENGFFIRSSYSGKAYTAEQLAQGVKFPPAREAFVKSFDPIKNIIEPIIGDKYCLIQLEWMYTPNGFAKDDPNSLTFVATSYRRSRLGNWSTFGVIRIDGDVDPAKVESQLLSVNNDDVKFVSIKIDTFEPINLKAERVKAESIIKSVAKSYEQYKVEATVITNKRANKEKITRAETQHRDMLLSTVRQSLLSIQEEIYKKVVQDLQRVEGVLGDVEGYVVKAGDLLFKVNTPKYMEGKHKK